MFPGLSGSCVVFLIALNLFLTAPNLCAQNSETEHVTFDERVQGSVNTLGAVTKLDTSAGYIFNPRWSASLGVPFYFVSPSSSTTAATGASSVNGLGNVYAQIRFALPNPTWNYVSTLTGAAPTGDRDKGLSTGHAIVDWSNYADHRFGRFTPFGEIGFANSVADTEFFIRPYITSGFVTHAQAGARYRLARWINVNASGYAIQPAGQQTVISRIVTVQKKTTASSGSSPVTSTVATVTKNLPPAASGIVNGLVQHGNSQKPVFETTTVTTGSASIARDRGYSTWLTLGSSRVFNLYAGYTRSTEYDLNTVFFGIGVNLRKAFGSLGL
jgi:hypothetical protein